MSRLKKIECRVIKEDFEFCNCPKERIIKMPGEKPLPETCEKCGKPLLITVITFNFNSNVKLTGKA